MKNKNILYILFLSLICFIGLSVVGGAAEAKKEKEDKEYWCKKANAHRKKIEKAQSEIAETEEKLAKLKDAASRETGKKRRPLESDIKKTEKRLKEIERQRKENERKLGSLEEEAHRKGIPPGWLRCQFTF